MRIAVIQMDMKFADPKYNFAHAEGLVRQAALQKPDVITLPETWNVGFFPEENLPQLSDIDGADTKAVFSALAKEYQVNIVAGSVANQKGDKIYNSSYIFNRTGECIANYDKCHLFSPMKEHHYFTAGTNLCTFALDGISCGIVICYDIRFPELVRTLTLSGIDLLFVVAQWPAIRRAHWRALTQVRAIENQCFLCSTNSCGVAGATVFGGTSTIYDPWGEPLVTGGSKEMILTADLDFTVLENIRESINVFRDRRPELYQGLQS